MITDDEYLERVVAGINALANPGADVQWNVKLAGRQFDVVVKFEAGPYRFLVLIEVKDHTRKTSVDAIEAMVTKAKDQLANKIVFFSKAGYQAGAIEVAKKHGVDLFQIEFAEGALDDRRNSTVLKFPINRDGTLGAVEVLQEAKLQDEGIKVGNPVLAIQIQECSLIYDNGKRYDLPTEPTQMQYYAQKSRFADGRTLEEAIGPIAQVPLPEGQSTL